MRKYELALVVNPSVKEADRKKLLETIKAWLKGVKVVKEEDLGSKALAYKIGREMTGHYYDLQLETDTNLPADFEKRLFDNEEILRHLVIRLK